MECAISSSAIPRIAITKKKQFSNERGRIRLLMHNRMQSTRKARDEMSKHHASQGNESAKERREERREKDKDILAKEMPDVLESSDYDPELPAMQEFEVDEGGPKGSTRKHPGLIWAVIAIVAVIVLVVAFMMAGDWFTPDQAEQEAQAQFEEQVVPEDLGEGGDVSRI